MANQAEFAALLDELKKINARLDKLEEVTATLKQELHNCDFTPHTRNHTVEEIKLADLPTFEGDGDPKTYLDWERRLDRLFRYKNLDDTKRFHYAILKLTKYASLWFESFQHQRERDGKAQLTTWTELKQKMKKF
uniref:Retrotransposon gag domain-containing protein n=1 Tax=Chenopodium quinoa TaxID=63459 RepID=A0A803M625_CHEQI